MYYSSNKELEQQIPPQIPSAPFRCISDLYCSLIKYGWERLTAYDPKLYDEKNKCVSQCNVTVLLVKKYFGGDIIKYPNPTSDKKMHYFNRICANGQNCDIDLTSEQFESPLNDYASMKEKGNKSLTKYCRHVRIAELRMEIK